MVGGLLQNAALTLFHPERHHLPAAARTTLSSLDSGHPYRRELLAPPELAWGPSLFAISCGLLRDTTFVCHGDYRGTQLKCLLLWGIHYQSGARNWVCSAWGCHLPPRCSSPSPHPHHHPTDLTVVFDSECVQLALAYLPGQYFSSATALKPGIFTAPSSLSHSILGTLVFPGSLQLPTALLRQPAFWRECCICIKPGPEKRCPGLGYNSETNSKSGWASDFSPLSSQHISSPASR